MKMSSKIKDLTGEKFGKLTVIEYSHTTMTRNETNGKRRYSVHWTCQCDCGKITTVKKNNLMSGNSTTCGCSRKNNRRKKNDVY